MNRHRKPWPTIGVKILAAGALGSAAVMAMHHPDAATHATLTANVNLGLPQNNTNSSGASTNINGLDIPSSTGLPVPAGRQHREPIRQFQFQLPAGNHSGPAKHGWEHFPPREYEPVDVVVGQSPMSSVGPIPSTTV
jgi:hypothetical protein